MKIKVDVYATQIKKSMGLDKALKVAQERVKNSDPKLWENLPKGSIYFKKDKKGNEKLPENELRSINGFWVQVYNILLKMNKGL